MKEETTRQDRTMRRSELQVHTVASADTSVITPRDAIQAAVAMGYKAVAITDCNCVQSYYSVARGHQRYGRDMKLIYGAELSDDKGSFTVLVKDRLGMKALYRLISGKTITPEERTHLLIGSSHHHGELYRAVANDLNEEETAEIAKEYDYIELYVGQDGHTHREINKKLYTLGKSLSIPVVAVGGCHYVSPEDAICKEIVDSLQKNSLHTRQEDLSMRTTEEMLNAFSYLGEDAAYEVVVTNSNLIADRAEQIDPDNWDFPAFTLPDAEDRVRDICAQAMETLYGANPPEEITRRLETELSLMGRFASLYLITYEVAKHIHTLGGMVGFRGYIGSTLIAYLMGISDVNTLPAHYRCGHCLHTEFAEGDSGYDLPKKTCPHCGQPMTGDGHNLPYETAMGPTGDKEPILDLNVPPSLRAEAVRFLADYLGRDRVAYAGATDSFGERLAEGYMQVYAHQSGKEITDEKAVAAHLANVKKREGLHPNGIVLLPQGMQWEDVTPLRTLDTPVCGIDKATHMDYYHVEYALPKINICPYSVLDRLQKLFAVTGAKPEDVDYSDPAIYDLFFHLDTCGIPEYASPFCKDLMCEIGPMAFSDLIRVCGMSHGTNTWNGNGEVLIRDGHEFRELIGTRDDIFLTLQKYGLDSTTAFSVMENVRKGKFSLDNARNEQITAILEQAGVPQWYIQSMKRILYLFPKAHAANYTKLSVLAAWFKVYYPEAFYNVTLESLGAMEYLDRDDFELECMLEELSTNEYGIARQREPMELLLEARNRNIPINI